MWKKSLVAIRHSDGTRTRIGAPATSVGIIGISSRKRGNREGSEKQGDFQIRISEQYVVDSGINVESGKKSQFLPFSAEIVVALNKMTRESAAESAAAVAGGHRIQLRLPAILEAARLRFLAAGSVADPAS